MGDRHLPADISVRDRRVAEHAKIYLDLALDEKAMTGLVTWNLSDKYSWVSITDFTKRSDGLQSRVLPLDNKMARKPLWHAIAAALDHAPVRP